MRSDTPKPSAEIPTDELSSDYDDLLVEGERVLFGASCMYRLSNDYQNRDGILMCTNRRLLVISGTRKEISHTENTHWRTVNCLSIPYRRILNFHLDATAVDRRRTCRDPVTRVSTYQTYLRQAIMTVRFTGEPREIGAIFHNIESEEPAVNIFRLQKILAQQVLG